MPPHTRVLKFKEEPDEEELDLRRESVRGLRGENEALLQRVGELEAMLAELKEKQSIAAPQAKPVSAQLGKDMVDGDGGMVPRASYELVHNERKQLEDALVQKEKRLLRLQQVSFPFLHSCLSAFCPHSLSRTSAASCLR